EQKTLSPEQAAMLLRQPGTNTLTGLRDTAILALMLGTGLREQEVIALQPSHLFVSDLQDQRVALYVPDKPGCVERTVPFLAIEVHEIVQQWLHAAETDDGPVFRGFYRGGKVRPTPLSRRALQQVLASYPIEVDGEQVIVRPLDLRRTYARLLYDQGYDFFTIQRYLGVKQANTVASYLAGERQPTWEPLADIFDLPGLREPFSRRTENSQA
ncbi:MAG TPA: tyrosine-type recombinase/integrase, partial [Bellilinea sp.]|nr:tyrosine-type recombinase/integrase [Bellilinea sp.]